jgi:hypothetical protein
MADKFFCDGSVHDTARARLLSIIENSGIHDINRTAYASVAIYGNVNKLRFRVPSHR